MSRRLTDRPADFADCPQMFFLRSFAKSAGQNKYFMMKTTLFFLLLSVGAFAQTFKIDSTTYNGKKYWIYPYKFEWNGGGNYSDSYSYDYAEGPKLNAFQKWRFKRQMKKAINYGGVSLANQKIPPVLDSLPSGDYLVYYAMHPNTSWWKKTFKTYKPQIGAIFHVENGVMNGKIS